MSDETTPSADLAETPEPAAPLELTHDLVLGQPVWLFAGSPQRELLQAEEGRPVAATVFHVDEDNTVNVLATGPTGVQVAVFRAAVGADGDTFTGEHLVTPVLSALRAPAQPQAELPLDDAPASTTTEPAGFGAAADADTDETQAP